jgi:hypothetical protein
MNTGVIATAAWLVARELAPKDPKWFVEIAFEVGASRFLIEIYAEEWGFMFEHEGRISWIRITDVPFVHGRDDHELLNRVPRLNSIGSVMAELERKHDIRFEREAAMVRTNLAGADAVIADWVRAL